MTLALTSIEVYAVEADEALTKKFKQVVVIKGTGATSDITHDLGTDAGTFWTAVAGATATAGLAAIKEVIANGGKLATVGGSILAKVKATATAAGCLTQSVTSERPQITYYTAEAPTTFCHVLEYDLPSGAVPTKYSSV
jgi:hypothetical protein